MMHTVNGNPTERRILERTNAENGERPFQPLRTFETAMSQESVIADVDSARPEEIVSDENECDPGPREKVGKSHQGQNVKAMKYVT